jgi:N-acetylmuramoyl-L-alanine amidase
MLYQLALQIRWLLLAAVVGLPTAAGAASVEKVRLGQHGERTRIVLDISEAVDFQVFSLADPYRVVVDLPEMAWNADSASFKVRAGPVSGLRFGLYKPGNSRLVLDVNGPVLVDKAFVLTPGDGLGYRFVIDLVPTDRDTFLASLRPSSTADEDASAAPAAPAAAATAAAAPPATVTLVAPAAAAPTLPMPASKPAHAKDAKRVVVLDPGHGGVDPGTVALSGRFEKHVALDYALEVRRILEARGGYTVIMTRDKDVFVPLRDRVRIAHEAAADLFISIHADSIADRTIRGGAVYTLSEKGSDAEADALAARENKSDLIAGVTLDKHDQEVVSILIELAQRETMNYSVHFANDLLPQFLRHRVPMRATPHRFAAFAVLKAPDVPSVLVELGYLTNKADERFLLSDQARAAVAAAIAGAVEKYFADLES